MGDDFAELTPHPIEGKGPRLVDFGPDGKRRHYQPFEFAQVAEFAQLGLAPVVHSFLTPAAAQVDNSGSVAAYFLAHFAL